MIDEKEFDEVLDAAGACMSVAMLDRLLISLKHKSGRGEMRSPARYVSHSVQTLVYEQAGFGFAEVDSKRVAHNGVEWRVDDSLPLDCILVESEYGNGLLKNLYPLCPECLRRPRI